MSTVHVLPICPQEIKQSILQVHWLPRGYPIKSSSNPLLDPRKYHYHQPQTTDCHGQSRLIFGSKVLPNAATEPRRIPERLTWNLGIRAPWKRKIIFQTIISRFYVNLPGCTETLPASPVWIHQATPPPRARPPGPGGHGGRAGRPWKRPASAARAFAWAARAASCDRSSSALRCQGLASRCSRCQRLGQGVANLRSSSCHEFGDFHHPFLGYIPLFLGKRQKYFSLLLKHLLGFPEKENP